MRPSSRLVSTIVLMGITDRQPRWQVVLGAAALALLVLPTIALLTQAPWSDALGLVTDSQSLQALRVSIVVSLGAAALATLFGIPLALVLTRTTSRAVSFLRTAVVIPLILPPVATGVGLLAAFGRLGLTGRLFGFGLANTTLGAILASTVAAMPFLVLSVEGGLRDVDNGYCEVATGLGATPNQKLWHVTLPLARRSILAGVVLAWARALGEFGATITFAGNIEGVTRTLPLQIALSLEQDRGQALVLSLLMIFISLVVLFALRRTWFHPIGAS